MRLNAVLRGGRGRWSRTADTPAPQTGRPRFGHLRRAALEVGSPRAQPGPDCLLDLYQPFDLLPFGNKAFGGNGHRAGNAGQDIRT